MRILIATKNRGKFNEITGVLNDLPGAEIVFLGDVMADGVGKPVFDDSDFVEDGDDHRSNALKKARYYYDHLADAMNFDFVLGEDSGIYVDALGAELGVHTRRWGAGENATDEEWLDVFMKEMERRAGAESQRGAKFVCHACLIGGVENSEVSAEFFEGETYGVITQEVASKVLPGLPLSSVFLPEGYDKVYAELSQDEKNAISHRGQAISKIRGFLDLGRES